MLVICESSCGIGTCIGPNQCACPGDNCNASSTNPTIQGVLIAIVIILAFTILGLGILIFYMICLKRRTNVNDRMGLAGMDELHTL